MREVTTIREVTKIIRYDGPHIRLRDVSELIDVNETEDQRRQRQRRQRLPRQRLPRLEVGEGSLPE